MPKRLVQKIAYCCVAFVLSLSTLLMVSDALAQSWKVEEGTNLRQLDREVQQALMRTLRQRGIEFNQATQVRVTTANCPANCNGKVLGGVCFCNPTDGKCPGGTTGRPHGTNPPTECSVNPRTASVKTTDMSEPQTVQLR